MVKLITYLFRLPTKHIARKFMEWFASAIYRGWADGFDTPMMTTSFLFYDKKYGQMECTIRNLTERERINKLIEDEKKNKCSAAS